MMSHICEDCGNWKKRFDKCQCYDPTLLEIVENNPGLGGLIDKAILEDRKTGFEIGLFKEERKVEMSLILAMPYGKEKTTKRVFLEKCFGEWWVNSPFVDSKLSDAALRGWFGCAERFGVPQSAADIVKVHRYSKRTSDEAFDSLSKFCRDKQTLSIPVQESDDDQTIFNALLKLRDLENYFELYGKMP